ELKDELQGEMRTELKKELQEEVKAEMLMQNQKRFMHLISVMTSAGESHLLPKLGEDEGFLQQMYKKYNL
ncbi:MAG: hypothetical protein Q4F83_15885, partial [Eubacteriales bacterium]|nr:hypothetical protein [Eubacteriales bacterium]